MYRYEIKFRINDIDSKDEYVQGTHKGPIKCPVCNDEVLPSVNIDDTLWLVASYPDYIVKQSMISNRSPYYWGPIMINEKEAVMVCSPNCRDIFLINPVVPDEPKKRKKKVQVGDK